MITFLLSPWCFGMSSALRQNTGEASGHFILLVFRVRIWYKSVPSRHSSDKVAKLESQVESYKKKLEDLGDLRRQVKLLEEKNTVYMQNTVSLEEELRKANAARSQLETYKRQVRTGIINIAVLYIAQHILFITWLIPRVKKKLWANSSLCLGDFQVL